MAFSWHNHCLCRVGAWSRTSHARWIADVRKQPDWGAAVEQFSLLFFLWLLSGKTGAENSQNLHHIVELISRIEGLLQSWSSTALQVTSVCVGIFQNTCCLLKQSFNRRQASRHCQSALDMNPERPDWPGTHTLSEAVLFLWPSYIQNVTRSEQKLHHSACSCPRRLRVWGRSKFTKHSLTLQEKALHFFFWVSHYMLAVGALETWTWWPHLSNFRLDVLIVVFSGSDSFSQTWSHAERERERER